MLARKLVTPVCCALAAAALLTPRTAFAGTGAAPNPGPATCSSYVSVALAAGQMSPPQTVVNSGADVQCAAPEVTGTAMSGPPSSWSAPANGTGCTLTLWEPVTLKANGPDPQTGMASFGAQWPAPQPAGTTAPFSGLVYEPATPTAYQSPGTDFPVSDAALVQGFNDVQVRFDRAGQYQGGVCQEKPGSRWNGCQVPNAVYYGSGLVSSPCARSLLHIPQPTRQPGYGLDQIDLKQVARGVVQSGDVSSMPQANSPLAGLVNLPTYFWLVGVNAIQPLTQVLRIATPADITGRSLVYQYIVTTGLDHVVWDFGDGSRQMYGGTEGLGQPWPQHSTVQHSYVKISSGSPGGTYKVTATETYQVNVTAVWWNGVDVVSQQLPNFSFSFDQPAIAENLAVGQLEGVPGA
jgi:hypothetical protein